MACHILSPCDSYFSTLCLEFDQDVFELFVCYWGRYFSCLCDLNELEFECVGEVRFDHFEVV